MSTTTITDGLATITRQAEAAQSMLNGINNAAARLRGATFHAIVPTAITDEPEPGSIVLLHGLSGTVYQRLHGDGLFHSTTGDVCDFDALLAKAVAGDPNGVIYLVYRGVA